MITDEQFADALKRIAALEAKQPVEPASDALLARFADDVVKVQPKNWKGRTIEGVRFSDLTSAEAKDLSGYYAWKARKGAEENPPRCDRNGKPWHERDALIARVLMGFAMRGGTTATVPAETDSGLPF